MRCPAIPLLVLVSCAAPSAAPPTCLPDLDPDPGHRIGVWAHAPGVAPVQGGSPAEPTTIRNLMELVTLEEVPQGEVKPKTLTRHRAGIDYRSSLVARFSDGLEAYAAGMAPILETANLDQDLADLQTDLLAELEADSKGTAWRKSVKSQVEKMVHAEFGKEEKMPRAQFEQLAKIEAANRTEPLIQAVKSYLDGANTRRLERLTTQIKVRQANPIRLAVWAETRKFGEEERQRIKVHGYDTLDPLSKEAASSFPTKLTEEQLKVYRERVKAIEGAEQKIKSIAEDSGDASAPEDPKVAEAAKLALTEIKQLLALRDLGRAPDAVVNLASSGAADLDSLFVTFALIRNGPDEGKKEVVEEREVEFRVVRRGVYATLPVTSAFVKRTRTSNNFKTSPALSWLVHCRSAEYPYSEGLCGVLDYVSPGFGFHLTTTNYDSESSGVGLGVSLSLFDDWVQFGYGAALNVNDDREYYWVGIGLYDIFQGIQAK